MMKDYNSFYIDKKLKEKLDLMIKRMTKAKKDNLVLIDGDEGDGKTNMASLIGNYVSKQTGRSYNLNNIFFELEKLNDFAIKTKERIIHWDEGALGGFALEWWDKNQKKLIKYLHIARKRKHFFIICIPKFFKLNEYLALDRSIALIHVYMRKGIEYGRFTYYSKRKKEKLFDEWKRKRKRAYKKLYSFRGSFPETLGKIVDEVEYDKRKDVAIMSINKEDERRDDRQFTHQIHVLILENLIPYLEKKQVRIKNTELAPVFGVSESQIRRYRKEIASRKAAALISNRVINQDGLASNNKEEDIY